MFRRCLSVVLTLALVHAEAAPALARGRVSGRSAGSAEQVPTEILRLRIIRVVKKKPDRPDARQGWVDRADADTFAFAMKDATRTIAYRDVERAKKAGTSILKKTRSLGVGFGILYGIAAIAG